MMSMNKNMNMPEMSKIMQEFAKQNEIMDMKEEMMSDMIDDTMGEEDDEEEEGSLVNQVLDEIGLDLGGQVATPANKLKKPVAAKEDDAEDDLAARLDSLKKT